MYASQLRPRMSAPRFFTLLIFAAALVTATGCAHDFCNQLADEVCACNDVNPRYCEQARAAASAADADETGARHRDCRAEVDEFTCEPFQY